MASFTNALSALAGLSLALMTVKAPDPCPGLLAGTPVENEDLSIPDEATYNDALASLDIHSVFEDIYDVMLDSQECFPADSFNGEESYAGLFLRLAWHASGTFRDTDGAGGSPGGRMRYQPESAWDDNVNLDKARALLAPIKETYGDALSWGDLFVFAGNAAILYGEGPMNEVCAGRVDDIDGTKSNPLNNGTTCNPQGDCQEPLGSSTVGLIYVNPEGFLGIPDPNKTSPHIREIFGRMGQNDRETVALIGGGHAFGKCHGPCPDGPGPNPIEDPVNPWPGNCGDNFPQDVFTSGFEGAWTTYPFLWDNEYFTQLQEHASTGSLFDLIVGPGGKYQWRNTENYNLMLTADIALVADEDYLAIVNEFADDIYALDYEFAAAWKKLTESGGTFADNKFCVSGDSLRPNACQYVFGQACNWCRDIDNIGCQNCRVFYQRVQNEDDGLYYCERIESDDELAAERAYLETRCESDNCLEEDNPYCEIQRFWGCRKCFDGFFRRDNDHLCTECSIIPHCKECNSDMYEWGGCDECEDGYTLKWDTEFRYRRCLNDMYL